MQLKSRVRPGRFKHWCSKTRNLVITLDDLRRYGVARNFPKPTTLKRALDRAGFIQADPIRAPARAQDLILRQRVKTYHAGDLERLYESLDVAEDFFINYGYVTPALQQLMHPRSNSRVPADDVGQPWTSSNKKRAKLLLDFIRERGSVHPREVDQYFSHGKVTNYWGGSSNATTHLLDAMHYAGSLRIARREKGIRVYSIQEYEPIRLSPTDRDQRIDGLVDTIVNIYGPLPAQSFSFYLRRLRYAVPQWKHQIPKAVERAKQRLWKVSLDGVTWYASAEISGTRDHGEQDTVRFLAPFDPLVHDRWRFEKLWGWVYRFEAYTPVAKRKLGYYAMPLLWRDKVIGWANLSVKDQRLVKDLGYVEKPPGERSFRNELDCEIARIEEFLGVKRK